MAGPKFRIPRSLGLSRLSNRGLGHLAPLTDLKAPRAATPALGATLTAPGPGIARDGFSHPQPDNPWRIFAPAAAASDLLMSPPPKATAMARLGIIGGEAGKYPALQHFIPVPVEADRVSTQDFLGVIVDHFHSNLFKAPDLRTRYNAILDRLAGQEASIDSDFARKTGGPFPISTATQAMFAADAFLAHTQARSETFVELLDLRVEASLREKLGANAALTDMDFEAGRNHVLAEVLSEGVGTHLPIASGKISVSTHEGVIVLRPERLEDYAAIDRSILDGKISGEALTGGFYCGKSALGLPFIVINPNMGPHAWGVLRHELQHLRRHAGNRLEPFWQMPTPDAVADYPEALRQHFFVLAKDEVLAYLEEGTPPADTVSTLTRAGGLYDVISKKRDKIHLGDDDVARLRQGHVDYISRQVWAMHTTVTDLVDLGWHPEAARRALVDAFSDIPFARWERQLPMAAELLKSRPPERIAPPPGAHDGRRAELRRFLETEVLPRSKTGWKKINALARRQNQKMEAIERETRGPVSTHRLQELRRELQAGNSDMEQLAEVLQLVMDECQGRAQVLQRRTPVHSAEVRANSTRHRKLLNQLIRLETVSRTVAAYLKRSGIAEMQTRIDRMLLIRTAHSQKLFMDSVGTTLDPSYIPAAAPRIRPADVAGMRPKDRLENIVRLHYGMLLAPSPAALARATSLYATFVRHAALPQVMLEHEFETLMAILEAHPDWMTHLKVAFLGVSGAMIPEDWQRLLQAAIPTSPAAAVPRPAPTMGAKTRLLRDIAHYRDALRAIPRDTTPIARAIDALEDALRDNAPVPRVVVRYGLLTPELINPTLSQGAPKEVMAHYFIVRDGQSAPPATDPWLSVVDMDVPLDRFVRYLVKGDPMLMADGQYITTTSQTNAAFNQFLMNTFVRRHVTVQEGMLTPELVSLAQRQMLTLEVRARTDVASPAAAPASGGPSDDFHKSAAALGADLRVQDGGPQSGRLQLPLQHRLDAIWDTAGDNAIIRPETPVSIAFPQLHQLPKTLALCRELLMDRARALGTEPGKVRVLVAGPGMTAQEMQVWQELGADVLVSEPHATHYDFIQDALRVHPAGNVTVSRQPAGDLPAHSFDIVVWTHPMGARFTHLTHALRPGGIIVVQTDLEDYAEHIRTDPSLEVITTRPVDPGHYLMPSNHLGAGGTLVIARRRSSTDLKTTVVRPKGSDLGPSSFAGAATPPATEAVPVNDPDAAWRNDEVIVSAIIADHPSAIDADLEGRRVRPDFDLTERVNSYIMSRALSRSAVYVHNRLQDDSDGVLYPAADFLRIMAALHQHPDIPRPERRRGQARSEEGWEAHLHEAYADDHQLIRDVLAYSHFHIRELAQELQVPEHTLGARVEAYRNALGFPKPEVPPGRVAATEANTLAASTAPRTPITAAAPEVLQQAAVDNRDILRTIRHQPRGLGTTTMKLLGRAYLSPRQRLTVPFQVLVDSATGKIRPEYYTMADSLRRQGHAVAVVVFHIFAVQRSSDLTSLQQELKARGEWDPNEIPPWLMRKIHDAAIGGDLAFAYAQARAEAGGNEPRLRDLFEDRVKFLEVPADAHLPSDVRKSLRTLAGARFDEKNSVRIPPLPDLPPPLAPAGEEGPDAALFSGAALMLGASAGSHHVGSGIAAAIAAYPLVLAAATGAAAGVTLYFSRFSEKARLNRVIESLGIRDLIARYSQEPGHSIHALNAFLRGALGREPTLAEVRKLNEGTRERDRGFIYGTVRYGTDDADLVPQIFQVYTKEFLDALAVRMAATAQAFREKHGRDPVIVEIAAGDGRLARALRRRGIPITATDNRDWKIRHPEDVNDEHWTAATERADIILGSWLPNGNHAGHSHSDVPIAQLIRAHPEKTYIQIEASCTNTGPFHRFVSEAVAKGTLTVDEPPEFPALMTARHGYTTHLRIYRGIAGTPIARDVTTVNYSGVPWMEPLLRDAAAWVRDTLFTPDLDAQPREGTATHARSWRAMQDTLNAMTDRLAALDAEVRRCTNQRDLRAIRDELDQVAAAHRGLRDGMAAMRAGATDSRIAALRSRFVEFLTGRAPSFDAAVARLRVLIDARLATGLLSDAPEPNVIPRELLNPLMDWLHATLGERARLDPAAVAKDPHVEIQRALARLPRDTAVPQPVSDVLDHYYRNPSVYWTITAAWDHLRAGGRRPTVEAVRTLIAESSRGFARVPVTLGVQQDDTPVTVVLPVAHHGRETEMAAASEARDPVLRAWVDRYLNRAQPARQADLLIALWRGIDRLAGDTLQTLQTASTRDALTALRARWEALSVIFRDISSCAGDRMMTDALSQRMRDARFSTILKLIQEKLDAAHRTPPSLPGLPPPLDDAHLDDRFTHYSGAPWTEDASAQLMRGARQWWGRLRHRVVPYAPHDLWTALAGNTDAIYAFVHAAMAQGKTLINPDTGAPFTSESLAGYVTRRRYADGHPAPDLVLPRPPDTTGRVSHYSGAPFVDRFIGLMIQQAAAARVTDPDYQSPAPGQLNDEFLREAPIYAAVFAQTFSSPRIERALMALNKFIQLVRSGRLGDAEIRDGSRALASALINGYAGEQSPIAPHSLLFYAHRLLGLTERRFSRDRHVQARIWEDEAFAGFKRYLPQPPAPEGGLSGEGAPDGTTPGARVAHHMQILPDVRPVVRGMLQGALDLLSRSELGRRIADHPWLRSALTALGLPPDQKALPVPDAGPDVALSPEPAVPPLQTRPVGDDPDLQTDDAPRTRPPDQSLLPEPSATAPVDISAENVRALNDIPAGQMGAAETITTLLARKPPAFITHHILTVEDSGVLTTAADPAGKKARVSLQVLDVLNLFRDTEQQKHLKRLIQENRLTPDGVVIKPEVPDWLRDFCLSRRSNDPLRTAYKYAKQAAVARAMRDGLSAGLAASARPTLQELFVSRVMAAVVVSKGKAFEKDAAPLLNDLHGIAVGRSPLRSRTTRYMATGPDWRYVAAAAQRSWHGIQHLLGMGTTTDTPFPKVARVLGRKYVDDYIRLNGQQAATRLNVIEAAMGVVGETVGITRLRAIIEDAYDYTHNPHTPVSVLENLSFGISNEAFLHMLGLENVITLSHPRSHILVKTAIEWFDNYRASGLSTDLDARRITSWLAAGIELHWNDSRNFEGIHALHQAEINALTPELRTGMIVCNLVNDREFAVLRGKRLIQKFGLQRVMQILVSAKTKDAQALQGHLAAIGFSPEIAPELEQYLMRNTTSAPDYRYSIEILLSNDIAIVEALFSYFKSRFVKQPDYWSAFKVIPMIRQRATRTGVALSPHDIARMAANNELAFMDIVVGNTLGAVDERSALAARLVQHRLSGELGVHHFLPPFASLGNPPSYHLTLRLGEFEGYCGFQLNLQDKTGRLLGTVGFQESDTHIDVVRYQGGRVSAGDQQDFLKFSGGLDAMQWLGLVATRFLSDRALALGKTLRWISGDRIHMGYPHQLGQPPDFHSIEAARAFWKTPHPEIDAEGVRYDALVQEHGRLRQQRHLLMRKEQATPDARRRAQISTIDARILALDEQIKPIRGLVTMYRRGPHTQRLYDTAAAALGFVRSDDGPWHTFTGRGLGDALRAKADPAALDASLKLADDAMRTDPVFSKWLNHRSPAPAPWAGGPLRQRLDQIAGTAAGAIFDTLPIAASADPDACKAAHIARMAILAPWVRQHVFHYDATIHLLHAMIAFAKDYRSRLGAARTAQERDLLATQWRREAPLFDEIAELMMQQARTPDEEDLAMEVSDRLLNGETGDLGTVSVLLRALEDMPSMVVLAADQTLGPRHKKHRLPGDLSPQLRDPSGLASELRSDFGIPTDTSWRAIQSLLEYTELASTGRLSIAELRLGAHDLAQVLANGDADDQSPIAPHSLLFYAHRLLGLSERQLARDNPAQAKVWEEEAMTGLTQRSGSR